MNAPVVMGSLSQSNLVEWADPGESREKPINNSQ
jgi:hypothetical protein